jgi:hypothetical protein
MAALLAQLRHPQIKVGEKREAFRRECEWPALLLRSPKNVSCTILDISVGGCRLRLLERVTIGEIIVLEIPAHKLVLDGTVVWKRSREVGIKFAFSVVSRVRN